MNAGNWSTRCDGSCPGRGVRAGVFADAGGGRQRCHGGRRLGVNGVDVGGVVHHETLAAVVNPSLGD